MLSVIVKFCYGYCLECCLIYSSSKVLWFTGSIGTELLSNGDAQIHYSVEDAIEHIGFGRFQVKVMFVVGLFQVLKCLGYSIIEYMELVI